MYNRLIFTNSFSYFCISYCNLLVILLCKVQLLYIFKISLEFEMISKYTSRDRKIEFKTQSSVKSVKSDITEPDASAPTKDSPEIKKKVSLFII